MLHSTSRIAPIPASLDDRNSKKSKLSAFKKNGKRQQQVSDSFIQQNHTNSSSNYYPNAIAPLCTPRPNANLTPASSPSAVTSANDSSYTEANITENVQVALRCRPLSSLDSSSIAWDIDTVRAKIQLTDTAAFTRRPQQQPQRQQKPPANKEYYFDNVAYGSDNSALYQSSIKPLIGQAMDGYNATVFAYGQTASGKTYTMMGTKAEPGIIPRAVEEIFSYIKAAQDQEFLLRVSYLEIYNETIRDLLAPENDNLKIHENKKRGIYVTPVIEEVVTCGQDVLNVIQRGEANRHISTTDYNLHSSRSHTIFQMVIESRQRNRENTSATTPSRPSRTLLHPKGVKETVKISQLNLIDLAGSEKAASNYDRRKEGAYINKSLLTLGTVISKLTESGKNVGHVPYRDSKLTRILQPSLSGNAKVVVICTISPHIVAIDESINTLKFATRVKKVVLSAKNDAVMDDKALLQQYRGEITELKLKLKTANDVLVEEQQSKQSMITAERQQFEEELFQMRLVRNALKERIDHLTKMILTSTSVTTPPLTEDTANTNNDSSTNISRNDGKQEGHHAERLQLSTQPPDATTFITTANVPTLIHNQGRSVDDTSSNPWVLVRRLQHENQELRQVNELLQKELAIHHQQTEPPADFIEF